MKSFAALALACFGALTATAQAAPFEGGNTEAGRKFFDQNHCNRCHMSLMGGDGSAIFTRPNHKVTTPRQVLDQLYVCSGGAGITLSDQDAQDLGAYLNRSFYHFK